MAVTSKAAAKNSEIDRVLGSRNRNRAWSKKHKTYDFDRLSSGRVPALLDHADEDLASALGGMVLLDVPAGLKVEHIGVDTALLGCRGVSAHGCGECTAGRGGQGALGVDERAEDRHCV